MCDGGSTAPCKRLRILTRSRQILPQLQAGPRLTFSSPSTRGVRQIAALECGSNGDDVTLCTTTKQMRIAGHVIWKFTKRVHWVAARDVREWLTLRRPWAYNRAVTRTKLKENHLKACLGSHEAREYKSNHCSLALAPAHQHTKPHWRSSGSLDQKTRPGLLARVIHRGRHENDDKNLGANMRVHTLAFALKHAQRRSRKRR